MYVKIASSKEELQEALSIRQKVFVGEQNVPLEEELDPFDATATHFILYCDKPIGTGRCRIVHDAMKVERICILPAFRGSGAGQQLMKAIEDYSRENGVTHLKLHSQTHAKGFYEKLGYHSISGEFLDAGILHVTMAKKICN